jgi:hypothetical protein
MRVLLRLICRLRGHRYKFSKGSALYNRGLDIYKDASCRRCGRVEGRMVLRSIVSTTALIRIQDISNY